MKYILAFVLLAHGLIHLMGFSKAFGYGNMTQLTKEISKPQGMLWLLAALLFVSAVILFLLKKDAWWILTIIAVILSQLLIIMVWKDAKFGTIANIILLLAAFAGLGMWKLENQYHKDVAEGLKRTGQLSNSLLTEKDIEHLPLLVQQYIKFNGAMNQPKINNMKIVFEGEMREKGKGWFPFISEQYNFFDTPSRLFFMKATMFATTVPGYHAYKNNTASMQVKLLGLYPVVNLDGPKLFQAETVTLFNDMCILAPASLIDKRIQWLDIDNSSVKAIFSNQGTTISALLRFNQKGELINFVSDDRISVSDMKNYRFSTPMSHYKSINGHYLGHYGEATWHYPDGIFTYGKFNLKSVAYNVKE